MCPHVENLLCCYLITLWVTRQCCLWPFPWASVHCERLSNVGKSFGHKGSYFKNLPTSDGSLWNESVVRATSDLCIGELSYLLEEVFTKLSLLGGSLVALASFTVFSTLAEFSSSDLFVRFSLSILFPIKKALFQSQVIFFSQNKRWRGSRKKSCLTRFRRSEIRMTSSSSSKRQITKNLPQDDGKR